MSIILGIDPGLRCTGFGVIDASNLNRLRYVASGTVSTKHIASKSLPERLKVLYEGLAELSLRYQPSYACIEIVFVNVNPQSTLLLGQARGACITALVMHNIEVAEYTALQMKQAIVGYGRASKSQIQIMVQQLLSLKSTPSTDAADALGLAITHAHAAKNRSLMEKELAQVRESKLALGQDLNHSRHSIKNGRLR